MPDHLDKLRLLMDDVGRLFSHSHPRREDAVRLEQALQTIGYRLEDNMFTPLLNPEGEPWRWRADVCFKDGRPPISYYFDEFWQLGDDMEAGPDWNEIAEVRVTYLLGDDRGSA